MAAGADYFPSLRRIASQPSGGGAPGQLVEAAWRWEKGGGMECSSDVEPFQ